MRRIFALFLITLCFALPSQRLEAIPFFDQLPDFKVRVEGDRELQDWLQDELEKLRKGSSVLKTYEDPRDVARYEQGNLQKLLRSRGYYDAIVRHSVANDKITYRVNPGPQYLIKSISIDMPGRLRQGFSGLPLSEGDPLEAESVLGGVKAIETYLQQNACLLNVDVSYRATIIRSEARAKLTYRVAASPEVAVGQVSIEGLSTVDEEFLRDKLQIVPGDCFSRQKLDAARLKLLRTNLISSINTRVSEPYAGQVNVTFVVKERRHRTLRLGLGYYSSEGAGVSAGWEHRNIFRRGEKIEIESKVNPVQQTLKAQLTVPQFLREDQNLAGKAELSNEERDSYTAESLTVGATVFRTLSKHRTASLGSELKFSQVEEEEQTGSENYQLLSFPLGLKLDTTDNILDARRGATAALELKPYVDMGDTDTRFLKTTLVLTGYRTAEAMRFDPTLSVRIKAGVISGLNNFELPADERFYAGGGGSVRGYAYQSLGPRPLVEEPDGTFKLGDPIGGRALSEISLEGRLRFSETWGGVLFVDGGNAYANPDPNFSDLYWGAGIGVRYITSFAPLRFDVAFPLDKRDDLDDDFQVYVSLGQAF
ncbi:autotransporter assembly complex protein TamA [Microbulbifer guangxiensis]|uniref:autotransporter assembly complex protein TamA n=1 Tax=Microbulbifer guangxiensis TaxID=2904249 RepID=UPI001F222E69|nr:autotransporter assembly complex family protein [Microbulbifer guangxiensis]